MSKIKIIKLVSEDVVEAAELCAAAFINTGD